MTATVHSGGLDSGFWGERTATLDWCELNYVNSEYIAELWNTLSNAAIIGFALLGMAVTHRYSMETRFYYTYAALLLVGVGSWAFHMTLRYENQLLDELPMLALTNFLVYCAVETGAKPQHLWLPWALALVSLATTVAYVHLRLPVFHHTVFGLLMSAFMLRVILICRAHGRPAASMFIAGISWFLLGFIVWNIDNIWCDRLRAARNHVNAALPRLIYDTLLRPLGAESMGAFVYPAVQHIVWLVAEPALQLHAWWHITSAIGSYYSVLFLQYVRATQGHFRTAQTVPRSQAGGDADFVVRLRWHLGVLPMLECANIVDTGGCLVAEKYSPRSRGVAQKM